MGNYGLRDKSQPADKTEVWLKNKHGVVSCVPAYIAAKLLQDKNKGFEITDPEFVAARVGGMTQLFKEDGSPELENGVPIYRANREFKGAPVSGPGWEIVENPFRSKSVDKTVKAMRLEVPPDASFPQGAIFYIPTEQIILESP